MELNDAASEHKKCCAIDDGKTVESHSQRLTLSHFHVLRRPPRHLDRSRIRAIERGDLVSDLHYLLNCYRLLFAIRGSHWRRGSPKKTLLPKRGTLAPAQPLR